MRPPAPYSPEAANATDPALLRFLPSKKKGPASRCRFGHFVGC